MTELVWLFLESLFSYLPFDELCIFHIYRSNVLSVYSTFQFFVYILLGLYIFIGDGHLYNL